LFDGYFAFFGDSFGKSSGRGGGKFLTNFFSVYPNWRLFRHLQTLGNI
jgi:hypothetical protein